MLPLSFRCKFLMFPRHRPAAHVDQQLNTMGLDQRDKVFDRLELPMVAMTSGLSRFNQRVASLGFQWFQPFKTSEIGRPEPLERLKHLESPS